MERIRVGFIGAGNVAWHLAPALDNAGFSVRAVSSRSTQSAKALVNRLYQAEIAEKDLSGINLDIIFITVSDEAIQEVVNEYSFPKNCALVHTSGTTPMSVISGYHPRSGVFYPLQTFTKGKKIDISQVPVFLEATDPEIMSTLRTIARAVSDKVFEADSAARSALHTAAVFVCNFTNHMFTIGSQLAIEKGIPFEVLKPLIIETVDKCFSIGPEKAQTGPAFRHDLKTLDAHMAMLHDHPEWADIYKVISQNIIDSYPEG